MGPKYWLMKTEPDVFSIDDLLAAPNQIEGWDGVRNYQARNYMRDEFRKGDLVFVYHSRQNEPAIVGTAVVVKEAYPDASALNPKSKYFDEKSAKNGQSRWVMVDIQGKEKFSSPISLRTMREIPALGDMVLLKKGQRLSIQPVTKSEYSLIHTLGRKPSGG
jgi:predicted RNA-binding protein with PUA-like domain